MSNRRKKSEKDAHLEVDSSEVEGTVEETEGDQVESDQVQGDSTDGDQAEGATDGDGDASESVSDPDPAATAAAAQHEEQDDAPVPPARGTATLNYQGRIVHKGVEFLPGVPTPIPGHWTNRDLDILNTPAELKPNKVNRTIAKLRTAGKLLVNRNGSLVVGVCGSYPIDVTDFTDSFNTPVFTITEA